MRWSQNVCEMRTIDIDNWKGRATNKDNGYQWLKHKLQKGESQDLTNTLLTIAIFAKLLKCKSSLNFIAPSHPLWFISCSTYLHKISAQNSKPWSLKVAQCIKGTQFQMAQPFQCNNNAKHCTYIIVCTRTQSCKAKQWTWVLGLKINDEI